MTPLGQAIDKAIRQQSIEAAMDELSERILRDSKVIELADKLSSALFVFMKTVVKHGPDATGKEFRDMVLALQEYREMRGVDS